MTVLLRARNGEIREYVQRDLGRPAPLAKIFLFSADPNHRYIRCRLVPNKGRIAIVTDAGWDAVDAAASGVRWVAGRIDLRERCLARETTALYLFFRLREASARHAALELGPRPRACRVEALAKMGSESADGQVVWS